jgi:hypothetical protein
MGCMRQNHAEKIESELRLAEMLLALKMHTE